MTLFDGAVAVLVVLSASSGWRLGFARVVVPLAAAGVVLRLSAKYANDLIVAHTSPAQVVARGWLTVAAFVLAPLLAATVASAVLAAVAPFDRGPSRVSASCRVPPRPWPCWRRRCGSSPRCRSARTRSRR